MIKREFEKKLKDLSKRFPGIAILGPRQSGKTTLAKLVFLMSLSILKQPMSPVLFTCVFAQSFAENLAI